MEITEVKVFPIGEEKLKAFVSVVFDRCFMVNDIKIIQGRDGLFISMPSRKKKNGDFKDVAHPLNNDTRRLIENEILGEYERVLEERGAPPPVSPRLGGQPGGRPSETVPAAGNPTRDRQPRDRPLRQADPPALDAESEDVAPPPRVAEVPVPQPEAPRPALAADSESGAESEEKPSLEEVQEIHLRDSFWSVS